MELAEVYRVIYEGPDDTWRGTIVCKDEENGRQYLYKNDQKYRGLEDHDKLKRLPIKTFDHIIPNHPIEASIGAKNGFSLSFDLFGVIFEELTFKYPQPDMFSTPLTEGLLSQDGTRDLNVLYAIFKTAAEAHVKVTFTNNSDPFDLCGVITARTSAIDHRSFSSLIFHKRRFEKIKVGAEDDIIIPLSRHIVAVPLGSQLILEFSLNVCDNDKMVDDSDVKRIVTFDAKKKGTSTTSIGCSKGVMKVEVKWMSMRKPRETEAN